jgi:hypothetical protein
MNRSAPPQTTNRLRDRIGFGYLILVSLIMLGIASYRPHRHYTIFTHAAADLFSGQNPYGKAYDHLGVMSFWLYSPTAAFIYKPLSLLSPHVGNFIYLALSILIFFGGIFFFLKSLKLRMTPGLGLFYFILSNEIIGAINNSKLELATTGLLFFMASMIIQGRRLFWAGVLLGIITNWKFQPLPTALLLGWAMLLEGRIRPTFRFAIGFLFSLAGAYVFPFFFFPHAFIIECYQSWQQALNLALSTTWQIYQSLYTSLLKITGWPQTIAQVTTLGAAIGGVLAAVVPLFLFYRSQTNNKTEANEDPFLARPLVLTALSLGSVYSVLFSPMSQSSAYILGTPFLLVLFVIRNSERGWIPSRIWTCGFIVHWLLTSYFYCDLALPAWRGFAGQMNLKPWGFTVLLLLFLSELLIACSRFEWKAVNQRPVRSIS